MTLQGSHGIFFYAQSVTAPPKDEPLQQGVSNVCFDDPRPGTMNSVIVLSALTSVLRGGGGGGGQ
jgi:hypothetical protein